MNHYHSRVLIALFIATTLFSCKDEDEILCSVDDLHLNYTLDTAQVNIDPAMDAMPGEDRASYVNGSIPVAGTDSVILEFVSIITSNNGPGETSVRITFSAIEHSSKLNSSGYYASYADFKALFLPGARQYRMSLDDMNRKVAVEYVQGQFAASGTQYYISNTGTANSNQQTATFNITGNCSVDYEGLGTIEIVEGNFDCILYNTTAANDSIRLENASFTCYFRNGNP